MNDFAIAILNNGDGTARLVITGEIDMANAEQIPAATEKALAEHPARILIDLAAVSFLDSSGIRNLLTAHRIAADSNA